MPLDTSIYANLLRPPKSVAEYDAEAMQGQTNRLALQSGQAQLQDRQRAIDDGNKLRQLVSGFGQDQGANSNLLVKGGFLKEAQAYDKGNADVAKTREDAKHLGAQTGKLDLEAVGIAAQQHRDTLTTINDPQSAARWVAAAYNDPRLAAISAHGGTLEEALARIPTDPKGFADWKMKSSLGAEKLIEYTTANANTVANNQTSIANNAATNATSRANNASTNATTQRGQNMVDARTRESTAATAAAGKVPSGYRLAGDGKSLEAIPGGPADPQNKPMTETQGKASLFATRMDKADKIMGTLAADGTLNPSAIKAGLEAVPLIGGALGAAGNYVASGKQQQLEQAQRDFVNAVLRQESGAAIGSSEFESAQKQYFPQRGDSAGVIKQKAENRRTAIEGMANMAGKGQGKVTPSAPASPSLPSGWSVEVH